MPVQKHYSMSQQKPIYLDHHSTTPVDPRVVSAMEPYWSVDFGNPSSHQHSFGWDAKAAVEKARKQVAGLLGAQAREIIFTGSATENINWLSWSLRELLISGQPVHAITSTVEHSATREAFLRLEKWGAKITWLYVDPFGRIRPEELAAALKPETRLVSLIYGHNELGSLNDLQAITQIVNASPAALHLDCAQSLTTVDMNVTKYPIDFVSISSHKLYGPKGIAALFVRRQPRAKIQLFPLLVGGEHESGLRASTVATPLAAGFGTACEIAHQEREHWLKRWSELALGFREALQPFGVTFNGLSPERLPQSVSTTFPIGGDLLLRGLQGHVAVSTGSACGPQSGPSRILLEIGLTPDKALSTLRFCLGRGTSVDQLQQVTSRLKSIMVGS